MKNEKSRYRMYGRIGMTALFVLGFLTGIFVNNSGNKKVEPTDTNIVSIEVKNTLPEKNCEAVEQLLLQELNDENSTEWWVHERNSEIYRKIIATGCLEHREMYNEKLNRSQKLLLALNPNFKTGGNTCEQIEKTLLHNIVCSLEDGEICGNARVHIEDAQTYANLSERGCPENSGKYKELAKQRLEIARALTDDKVERDEEAAKNIVETYKRIQMQAEAEKMLEKAKKMTGPAIDFIIQLEKIIEE